MNLKYTSHRRSRIAVINLQRQPPLVQRKFRGPKVPAQSVKPAAPAKTPGCNMKILKPGLTVRGATSRSQKLTTDEKTFGTDITPYFVIVIASGDESEHNTGPRIVRGRRIDLGAIRRAS